ARVTKGVGRSRNPVSRTTGKWGFRTRVRGAILEGYAWPTSEQHREAGTPTHHRGGVRHPPPSYRRRYRCGAHGPVSILRQYFFAAIRSTYLHGRTAGRSSKGSEGARLPGSRATRPAESTQRRLRR